MQEDKDTCRCKSKTWAEAILDFVDDRDISESSEKKRFVNNRDKRFYASFFGSVLFHLALLVMAARMLQQWPSTQAYLSSFLFIVVVSAFIAFIVSTGNKGGLIRRFWYGVTLPAVCYYLATKIIWPLVSTLETAGGVTS